mmetsp:Transcript_33090/g.108709  ORF Transcript_33090/g.108709 Transcript_33090/m.108709 type:complete len:224 (+) Transcript_33090:85-756(+)
MCPRQSLPTPRSKCLRSMPCSCSAPRPRECCSTCRGSNRCNGSCCWSPSLRSMCPRDTQSRHCRPWPPPLRTMCRPSTSCTAQGCRGPQHRPKCLQGTSGKNPASGSPPASPKCPRSISCKCSVSLRLQLRSMCQGCTACTLWSPHRSKCLHRTARKLRSSVRSHSRLGSAHQKPPKIAKQPRPRARRAEQPCAPLRNLGLGDRSEALLDSGAKQSLEPTCFG